MSALFVLLISSWFSLASNSILIDGVIANVNNEPILQSDLAELKSKLAKGEMIDDLALGLMNIEEIRTSQEAQLKYLIRTKMLDSEIKRHKLEITVERLEQELRDIAKRNGISRDMLPKAIEDQGMRFSDYQDYLKTRIERQGLIDQEVAAKLKISDDDLMAAYYNRFNKNPSASFEVELSHIFFNPKKGGASEAKSRAELVLSKLNSGQDFKSLASQYSEDPNFQEGGVLGDFKKNDLEAPLANAIEKHSGKGLIGDIIRTRNGFHIFFINSRKDIPDADFTKKKEILRGELFEKQIRFAIDRWFESKAAEFSIGIIPAK